jgi:5-methylcytosine-specific restriction endonuclease McrA
MKRAAYEKQGGICKKCGKPFAFEDMEGDHTIPWSRGGKTDAANCQMLCRACNREKAGK